MSTVLAYLKSCFLSYFNCIISICVFIASCIILMINCCFPWHLNATIHRKWGSSFRPQVCSSQTNHTAGACDHAASVQSRFNNTKTIIGGQNKQKEKALNPNHRVSYQIQASSLRLKPVT